MRHLLTPIIAAGLALALGAGPAAAQDELDLTLIAPAGAGGGWDAAARSIQEVMPSIGQARGVLREAAWGNEQPWHSGLSYLYEGAPDLDRLRDDLVRCAIRGYRFYDAIIERLR